MVDFTGFELNIMLDIYEYSTTNLRDLKKQIKIIKRMLNLELAKNQERNLNALTKIYALLYSAYAETAFLKLVHTPYGFSDNEINQIMYKWKKERNLEEKWRKCFELAFNKNRSKSNIGIIQNKQKRLNQILIEYIINPSQIRNKIAHGQWAVALNSKNTKINEELTQIITDLDYVQIDRLFRIYDLFSDVIEELIESPQKAHYRNYHSRITELEKFITRSKNWNIDSKKLVFIKKKWKENARSF